MLIWGGKVRLLSSHNGAENPFNEIVEDVRAGKLGYSLHRTTFREAVAQGLYARVALIQGERLKERTETAWVERIYAMYGDTSAEELDVIPSSGSGAWLTRALIESCMAPDIPVLRLAMPDSFTLLAGYLREAEIRDWCEAHLLPLLSGLDANLDHFFGEDFARTGDLSALWPLAQSRTLQWRTPFVVELRNVPFEQQKQVLFYLVDRLPRFRHGALDARGNGQYLAEVAQQKYGISRISQVMLSLEWYREHMPRLKAAFEDRTLLLPRDADILSDLRSVSMEKGVAKVPDQAHQRGSDGRPRHGDTAVALALASFATLSDSGPVFVESRPGGEYLDFQGY